MSKLTTEEFIKRSNKIHNNKFDYSSVNYINNATKVKIICPDHGIFEQIPMSHLRGNGCLKCTIPSTKDFIIKAIKKYGNKYDYSLVNYIKSKEKVKIICPDHGIFEQIPNRHLTGKNGGCIQCAYNISNNAQRSNIDIFSKKANIIHDNKYDYSLVDYINKETKVKIICPIHGIFEQRPGSHINSKNGCPKCKVPIKSSKGEQAVVEYIRTIYSGELITNKYDIIHPLELDIYLPELNIGIEYNGIYWHKLKEKNNPGSHKLKAKLCKDKGITLINILDLNWEFKQDKCKCKISNKLHS